jgi:oxidoreductase
VSAPRVAIVGAGWVVITVWLPLLLEAGVDVVSIIDPAPEARLAAQHLAPGARSYASWDPHAFVDCDLVFICSPNACHVEHAVRALTAGMHVVLEKPACFTVAAAEKLIALSRRHHRGLWVTAATSYRSDVRCLLQQARPEVLGSMNAVEVSWRRRAGIPRPGSWFTQAERAVAGSGADLGWHILEVGLALLGYPKVKSGFSRQVVASNDTNSSVATWRRETNLEQGPQITVDTQLFGALLTENGAVVQISTAWVSHQVRDETTIRAYAENGEIALCSTFGFSDCGVQRPSLTLDRAGVRQVLSHPEDDKMAPYRSFIADVVPRTTRAIRGSDEAISLDYGKLRSLSSAMAALYPMTVEGAQRAGAIRASST